MNRTAIWCFSAWLISLAPIPAQAQQSCAWASAEVGAGFFRMQAVSDRFHEVSTATGGETRGIVRGAEPCVALGLRLGRTFLSLQFQRIEAHAEIADRIDALLPLVSEPTRHLGNEFHAVQSGIPGSRSPIPPPRLGFQPVTIHE